MARGALYYYIESKESLLAAIHDRFMDPLLADARELTTLDASPEVRLVLLSECLMNHIVNRRTFVWVFLHEYRQLSPESHQRFSEKRKQFELYVTGLLEEGVESSTFSISDPRLAMLSWLNLHNYTYIWLEGESYGDSRELAWNYSRIFLGGISNDLDLDDLDQQVRAFRDAKALTV